MFLISAGRRRRRRHAMISYWNCHDCWSFARVIRCNYFGNRFP
jgi:hypothetical protein